MAGQFLELLETVRDTEASIQKLFGGEGKSMRNAARRDPKYAGQLKEAVDFIGNVFNGRRPLWQLKEALSTADFPLLFGDTIDRMMIAKYQTVEPKWRNWLHTSSVQDFRTAKRFRCTRGSGYLDSLGAGESYKADAPAESYYSFAVGKYGRRRDILWEALVNDDLDALKSAPDDLAYQARNTEHRIASGLYVANSTLYATSGGGRPTGGNKGTAIFSIPNLKAAITQMAKFYDDSDEPFENTPVKLVVPPALELDARAAISTVALSYTGTTDQVHPLNNILYGMLTVEKDPYIPILDTTNGQTSWYLFSDPGVGWAAEVAFLSGHEMPELFMKASNQVALGGGALTSALEGDFDNDAVGYKARHVIGGSHTNAVGGWRFTYWSDGTGA